MDSLERTEFVTVSSFGGGCGGLEGTDYLLEECVLVLKRTDCLTVCTFGRRVWSVLKELIFNSFNFGGRLRWS